MTTTQAQKQHAQFAEAALAQIEAIKAAIERSASKMQAEPTNWGVAGDMGAILQRLSQVC